MPRSHTKGDPSSEWLRALVEGALDGVIAMDQAGRIIDFNPAAETIFGLRRRDVIGKPVSTTLLPPDQRSAHEKGLARLVAGGQAGRMLGKRVEVFAMRADGSPFPAELEVISVSPGGGQVFMAYLRDITERKEAIRVRRAYTEKTKKTLLQAVLAISRMVEIRDPYTAGHQRRVAHLAASMAQRMGLGDQRIESVFFGALIHDIGKIAVPAEILSRPGRLMGEEVDYLHIHCHKGYEILSPVEFPWPTARIALQHHEHLDGSGYPQQLRDGEILLEARIITVADVVEALTSHRPYRPARPLRTTLEEVAAKAGLWYDPSAVAACLDLFESGFQLKEADMEALAWFSRT